MLRLLAWAAQIALLLLVAYNLATAVSGWQVRPPARPGSRSRRFRVVVPAHNEEPVIEGVLTDVAAQTYPEHLIDTWVVADQCTDATTSVAARFASVDERNDGDGGKGGALQWHLDRRPLADDEALVILDADNRIPPDLVERFSDELDAGHHVLQASLGVSNPEGSLLATASALSYWAGNRMVQLARTNLGWSADLGGTGMCFTAGALAAAGGFAPSLTEDRDLGVRLALGGIPVTWLHDVEIRDEKPASLATTVGQRARWMTGKRRVARDRVPALIRGAVKRRSFALFDQAIRLIQPGRSFVAFVSAVLTVTSALTGSRLLLPWPAWAAATVLQLVVPLVFLARDGVPARYLVRYPLITLLAVLWLPIRLISSRSRRWYHTPHHGS